MTRIFKYYNFGLSGAWTKANRIGMSSYPGCVSSTDNWYIMDSGLVVTDTSMEILNPTLYNRIMEFPSNSHVPDFMHVMITNRLSQTGAMWVSLFSEKNSGTGNAQWLIFDYNLFTPEKPIPDNSFWVGTNSRNYFQWRHVQCTPEHWLLGVIQPAILHGNAQKIRTCCRRKQVW